MKLYFEWQEPVPLARNKKLLELTNSLQDVENEPGVYYFARNFGANSYPFYIGQSLTLRARLKNHLDTRRIADILRGMRVAGAPEIGNGPRSFHFAYFTGKKGQNTKKALQIAERFMIGEAIARNLPLLNSKFTIIKTHSLTFGGSSFFKEENAVPLSFPD